jgi:hypothetical protein
VLKAIADFVLELKVSMKIDGSGDWVKVLRIMRNQPPGDDRGAGSCGLTS